MYTYFKTTLLTIIIFTSCYVYTYRYIIIYKLYKLILTTTFTSISRPQIINIFKFSVHVFPSPCTTALHNGLQKFNIQYPSYDGWTQEMHFENAKCRFWLFEIIVRTYENEKPMQHYINIVIGFVYIVHHPTLLQTTNFCYTLDTT